MIVKLILIVAIIGYYSVESFYLPGVAPYDFQPGEKVDLKVNKLRFVHDQSSFSFSLSSAIYVYIIIINNKFQNKKTISSFVVVI